MNINIPKGTKGKQTKIVELKDTASQYGSGLAEVFATPAMIAFMEQTAYLSIEGFLPEGHSTVGTSISAQHKKATLPNREVSCVSEVIVQDGKKVKFEITVYEGEVEIGVAQHTRYIINTEEFFSRLK